MATRVPLAVLFIGVISSMKRSLTCNIDLSTSEWRACRHSAMHECMPAIVPGTALTSLVANGTFAPITDLFFEDSLAKVPDIADTGPEFYTFVYGTTFRVPSAFCDLNAPDRLWLNLRGISYRAEVELDGTKINPTTPLGEAVGMYHRFAFDLGMVDDAAHKLRILVHPPDFPGSAKKGGQGGDHNIAKNAAMMQFTAGWDWIRATPDRNTGIWDAISLQVTGAVKLSDLFVQVTDLYFGQAEQVEPALGQGVTCVNATVQVHVSVSAPHPPGIVSCAVADQIVSINVQNSVNSSESPTLIKLDPVALHYPSLWWPHTHGDQPMYSASCNFTVAQANLPSDHIDTSFGVREIRTHYDEATWGRVFVVNTVPIFLQGGNWITTDQFLRFSTSFVRYYDEVKLHKAMGLNLIRVWGGGLTERPEFYRAADQLGVLVMQEFWMTGDNNGRWAGSYNWPLRHDIYLAAVTDVVKMLRNHPSLLFYCGGNELYPSKKNPPPDIAEALPKIIKDLDPGRFYIPSSMSNWTDWDPTFALAPKDGPYGMLDMHDFYKPNPGLKFWNSTEVGSRVKLGFQPEAGSSSSPVYRSLRRFLGSEALANIPPRFAGTKNHSAPPLFNYHNYLPFTDDTGVDQLYNYGEPQNMSEYCVQAQMAQYTQAKGLFEGFQEFMWSRYTAMLYWKTQSPWPVFRGAMYDSWLATTGGFWGVKVATAGPMHVQFNANTLTFTIINRWRAARANLSFAVAVYSVNGVRLVRMETTGLFAPGNSATRLVDKHLVFPPKLRNTTHVVLLRMSLTLPLQPNVNIDPASSLATNEYWLTDLQHPQNYSAFAEMRFKEQPLNLSVECAIRNNSVAVNVANSPPQNSDLNQSKVAFAVKLTLEKDPGLMHGLKSSLKDYDPRILPAFASKNYFSLLPMEEESVTIQVASEPLPSRPWVRVTGWNVLEEVIPCVREV